MSRVSRAAPLAAFAVVAVVTAAVMVAVTVAGCSFVVAPVSPPGSDDGDGDGGTGGLGPPMVGNDAIPTGAISFFKGAQCPTGWNAYAQADGRALVPLPGTAAAGMTVGTPLGSGEDRQHVHQIMGTFTKLPNVSYFAFDGNNGALASDADLDFNTPANMSSAGLPYVTLLVCQKTAPARAATLPLPPHVLMYFAAAACPAGWTQALASQGRFPVGVPASATPGVVFGGPPLASIEERTHVHNVAAAFTPAAYGVGAIGGCCLGDFAQATAIKQSIPTTIDAVDFPYVQLLQCEKQ